VPAVPWPLSSPMPFATDLVSLDAARGDAEQGLAQLARNCRRELPQLVVHTRVLTGHPVEALADVGADADLVVLGSSGRSALTAALLGSTAYELVRELRRPVVVVRDEPRSGHVVVGVDGSHASGRAVEFAFDFASRRGVDLVAAHAWADLPADTLTAVEVWDGGQQSLRVAAEQLLDRALVTYRERYPDVVVRRRVAADGPAHALLAEAEGAGLLVVGSHGRGALGRLVLGSVSHAVLHRASCPVAVIRAEETASAAEE
jgi:nucleotide-binding universal stress UspA family protein